MAAGLAGIAHKHTGAGRVCADGRTGVANAEPGLPAGHRAGVGDLVADSAGRLQAARHRSQRRDAQSCAGNTADSLACSNDPQVHAHRLHPHCRGLHRQGRLGPGRGDDPLRVLPNVTPPYLRDFRIQHPGFGADDDRNSMDHVVLRGGEGQTLRLHRTELNGAQARFEPCPVPLGSAQLGGIPPYPQAPCTTSLRLRKGKEEQAYYVFEIIGDSDRAAIHAHFGKWVAEHSTGGASAVRKGGGFTLAAGSRDGAWHLDVDSHNVRATTIVIRHTSSSLR